VQGNVVRVPVEAIGIERQNDIRLPRKNFGFDFRPQRISGEPGQHAVLMVVERHGADAERPRGGFEFLATSSPGRSRALTQLAVRHAEKRRVGAQRRAPRQQPAARDRLVVRVGEDRQNGTSVKIGGHRHRSMCQRQKRTSRTTRTPRVAGDLRRNQPPLRRWKLLWCKIYWLG